MDDWMGSWKGGRVGCKGASAMGCAHLSVRRAARAVRAATAATAALVHQLAATVRWQRVSAIWPLHPQLINNLFIYSFTHLPFTRRSREQRKLTNLLASTTTWGSSSWLTYLYLFFVFVVCVFFFFVFLGKEWCIDFGVSTASLIGPQLITVNEGYYETTTIL